MATTRAAAVLGLVLLQASLASTSLAGTMTCGALFCAEGSVCCDKAPLALCGFPGSTCCYNPGRTIANLCAPGSRCNLATGNCYLPGWSLQSNRSSSSFQCGALICAQGSRCCNQAPAALCGSPDSECCYNPSKSIANLCAKGTYCNHDTGNCYV
eukprot:UN1669